MNTHTIHRILALIIITAGIVGGSPELLAQNSSASAPAVGRALVVDFGNTGPDYVLQNDSTHQTASWFQDNNFHAYGPTIPAGWELKAVDRFPFPDDGFYYPSHVLFNPNTHQTAIWYFWQVNGADPRLIGRVDGPTLPSGWELVATGDFTPGWGGQTDYVLYDPRTRQTAVWYLNYTDSTPNQTGKIIFTRAADGPTLPADWSLIGVADFDGDGSTDYALFNPITRQTAIWYLNGTTVIGEADGPTVPPGWALVATTDHDYPDLLLYNASSRQTRILYLNVNIVVDSAYGPTIPSGWSLTTAPTANPATFVASYSFTANWKSVSGATGYWLDVSTSSSFNSYVAGYQNLNVGNTLSRSLTGLNASTTYYYRVRTYNGNGTSGNSNVVLVNTLSPTGLPVAITNPATLIASFSATLNGSVDPHGLTTTVYFQYGTTTSYGFTTPIQTKSGNTYQSVSANISGLSASTTYHFRIVTTNSAGTRYGSDRTFTTLPTTGFPVVTTNPATNVATSSATLHGSLDPHGLTTSVYFQYGTTTNYGHTTAVQSQTGNMYRNIAANIGGLARNTTYHFRIIATNSVGTRYGSDRTFTTQ